MDGFDEMFADIKDRAVTEFLVCGRYPSRLALFLRTPSWGPQGHPEERVYLPLERESVREPAALLDRLNRDYGDALVCYVVAMESSESPWATDNGVEHLLMWGKHIDGRTKKAKWEIKRNPLRLEARDVDEQWQPGHMAHGGSANGNVDFHSRVAYHGTLHIEKVLREGLLARRATDMHHVPSTGEEKTGTCPHIWLARSPEDAAHFGDVLEVNMEGLPGDFEHGEWQGCYHGGDLGPERLRRYVRPPWTGERKVGRNEPCPCGSGRKYKKCCGSG